MTDDPHADADEGPGGDSDPGAAPDDGASGSAADGDEVDPEEASERDPGTEEVDGAGPSPAEAARRASRAEEPDVSVTIEGKYDTVFERLEHSQSLEHGELDAIAGNIESTLLAVVRTGGGIRSEIYEAVDFELEDPWEIRLYLEVLEMHGLIRLQDDRWVPADAQEPPDRGDESG